jgi:hypothetical protein
VVPADGATTIRAHEDVNVSRRRRAATIGAHGRIVDAACGPGAVHPPVR